MLQAHPLSCDEPVKIVGFENGCQTLAVGFPALESTWGHSRGCHR